MNKNRRVWLLLVIGFALALSWSLGALLPAAQAAPAAMTYVVDRNDDNVVTACTGAPNDCSLRGALLLAIGNPGSTVQLQFNTTYTLSNAVLQDLAIQVNTTLNVAPGVCGVPPCQTIIQGGPGWAYRILHVDSGAAVLIDGISFRNGNGSSAGSGGGIANAGSLTMTNSSVLSNTATSFGNYGGGIFNSGTLVLDNTQVGNNNGFNGGGIASLNAGVVLRNGSSVFNNAATGPVGGGGGAGGGILSPGVTGTVRIDSSSVTSNTANGFGGGVAVFDMLAVTGTQIVSNTAYAGGGIDNNAGSLSLSGVTLRANTAFTSAGGGGGLRNDGPAVIDGSLFDSNVGGGGGGGGAIADSARLTVTNSTFTANQAGSGGALFLSSAAAIVSVDHSSFSAGVTTYGGALSSFGTLIVTNSTLSGNSAFNGGAIYNRAGAQMRLIDTVIDSNYTAGGAAGTSYGGGIFNDGRLGLRNVTLSNNNALNGSGGGLFSSGTGVVLLRGTTVNGNNALAGSGGGIANAGLLTVTNSTLANNTSVIHGGGISNSATVRLFNATLAFNTADNDNNGSGDGGGLFSSGTAEARNSLLGGNIDKGGQAPDCNNLTSQGYTLVQNTTGCTLVAGTGDVTGQNPKLAPLAGNGGSTWTVALLTGSPAIDAGELGGCKDENGATLTVDQRGYARPYGASCDIGAYEFRPWLLFLPLIRR